MEGDKKAMYYLTEIARTKEELKEVERKLREREKESQECIITGCAIPATLHEALRVLEKERATLGSILASLRELQNLHARGEAFPPRKLIMPRR